MYIVHLEYVRKQIDKLPINIVKKLLLWAKEVEKYGLPKVRQIKGYHDEPLKGGWKGHRSIRLSRAYRAIYCVIDENRIKIIRIIEVNKHEY